MLFKFFSIFVIIFFFSFMNRFCMFFIVFFCLIYFYLYFKYTVFYLFLYIILFSFLNFLLCICRCSNISSLETILLFEFIYFCFLIYPVQFFLAIKVVVHFHKDNHKLELFENVQFLFYSYDNTIYFWCYFHSMNM